MSVYAHKYAQLLEILGLDLPEIPRFMVRASAIVAVVPDPTEPVDTLRHAQVPLAPAIRDPEVDVPDEVATPAGVLGFIAVIPAAEVLADRVDIHVELADGRPDLALLVAVVAVSPSPNGGRLLVDLLVPFFDGLLWEG